MRVFRVGAGALLLLFLAGSAADLQTQSEPKKPAVSSSIDSAVSRKARLADDGEFLRRVMLDLVGYPPSLEEVKAFLADTNPNKRAAKIDELLNTEAWADFWSRRFAEAFFGNYHDVKMDTMPKLSQAARTRIVTDFVRWFKLQLQKDRPWTDVVAAMLDARGTDEGDPALAYKLSFYNEEGPVSEFANNVARHMLGIRLLCAKCHDHPFDNWTVEHFYGLAAFNARMRARGYGNSSEKDAVEHVEIKYADEGEAMINDVEIDSDIVKKSKSGGAAKPVFLFGGQAPPGPGVDRVKILVQLMTNKANTQLPRALANRVWGWLFGRGIVHPVDDFAARRNKPVVGGILDSLARDLIQNNYSVKHLVRAICNSQVYQLSCEADGTYSKVDFSRGTIQQLNGEQLINSILVATKGAPEKNVGRVLQMVQSLFPAGAIWCETTPLPGNARQALLLRNNQEIMGWISGGGVLARIKSMQGTEEQKVEEMFLAALSRKPTDAEKARYMAFLKQHPGSGWEDAYWTLLNSTEFVTRH
jgi:hypothetical protein